MKNHQKIKMLLFTGACLFCIDNANGQATSAGTAVMPNQPNTAGVDYLGWNNTVNVPLEIKHEGDQPIHFYTNAGNGAFNNQRMIIDKSPGHVGIGLNFNPGNDVLDIMPDANFPNTGYGINNQTVLHNSGSQNIFVGVGAGQNNQSGYANAFLGMEAGLNNMYMGGNTYIGWSAGKNFDAAENTFVGSRSGENNQGRANTFLGVLSGTNNTGGSNTFLGSSSGNINQGNGNTFLGHYSGRNFPKGDYNAFTGFESGLNASGTENVFSGYQTGMVNDANYNVFIGSQSGINNTSGGQNTFVGYNTGANNITGTLNTFLGARSGSGTAAVIQNATAIGANAQVLNNNKMILGDNRINVGIGLSGVPGGPLLKLHIQDDTNPQLRLSYKYDATVANGIWTDFQTTSKGDLYIHPSNDTKNRFVGINQFNPGNTLEINSGITAPAGARQPAGLRFTNLNTSSTPQPSPWPINNRSVLSVDANGDVILVNDSSHETLAMIEQLQQKIITLEQQINVLMKNQKL